MSASEKLGALNNAHTMSGLKVIPIYRKIGPKGGGDNSYLRARDVESVMDALPQILALAEVAEASHDRDLRPALTALEKALS